MKTIFNTYIEVTSQKQCNRLKEVCINNGLTIWDNDISFKLYNKREEVFAFSNDCQQFFIIDNSGLRNQTKVTESEWLELLKQHQCTK